MSVQCPENMGYAIRRKFSHNFFLPHINHCGREEIQQTHMKIALGYCFKKNFCHINICNFVLFSMNPSESKSLWHEMAESLLLVNSRDRDRFLDLCLRRHVQCDDSHFLADFKWRSDTTRQEKVTFFYP